jgi:hypothetical protein
MPIKQDDELDRFEEDIRKLKNQYDQFFSGIIKMPPITARRNLEATIHELNKQKMRDSGRRFRFQQLSTRFNQYRELWARRMREREEGPMEFKRRQAAINAPPTHTVEPPRQTAAPRVTSGEADSYVKVAPGTNGEEVRKLYEQIQSEHTRMGKPSNVTFEQLSEMVQKQSEMVRARYNVNTVAFRVETVDGKVKLKAKPLQE